MAIFQPPTDDDVSWVDPYRGGPANALMRFVEPNPRGRNVYLLVDGTLTEDEPDYDSITKIYFGGHLNEVNETEVALLTAAGYGAYIT